MAETPRYDVFVSYSPEDRDWAVQLAAALRDGGVTAWMDTELAPGTRWENELREALRQSRYLVSIVSPASLKNRWMFFELGAAFADGKSIIPILRGGVTLGQLPPPLSLFQAVSDNDPEAVARAIAVPIKNSRAKET